MTTFGSLAAVLEMVQELIDSRGPSESETDTIFQAFNMLRHALLQCQGWSKPCCTIAHAMPWWWYSIHNPTTDN